MNPNENNICKFFLKGCCKYGDKCKFSHNTTNNVAAPPIDNQDLNKITCHFFLTGYCNKYPNCNYFHGYGNRLKLMSHITNEHSKMINNLVLIPEKNAIITTDEKSIKIWGFNDKFSKLNEIKISDEEVKISKLIYSNNLIIWIQINKGPLGETGELVVSNINNNNTIKIDISNFEVNDILESGNVILLFGKTIEIFTYSPINNQLQKNIEIKDGFSNIGEITCACIIKNLIMCGHNSGAISLWVPGGQSYLKLENVFQKINENKINKMVIKEINNETHYIMTCGEDGTMNLLNFEHNLEKVTNKKFNSAVMSIYEAKDIQGTDNFFVVLGNGEVNCLNDSFIELFKIKENQGKRIIMSLKNPEKKEGNNNDNKYGDFLIITDNENFDIFVWIPKFENPKKNTKNPSHFHHKGPRGGYRGNFRGGY